MALCDLGTFKKFILRVLFMEIIAENLNWIYLKYQ